jgi:hypothetical protein
LQLLEFSLRARRGSAKTRAQRQSVQYPVRDMAHACHQSRLDHPNVFADVNFVSAYGPSIGRQINSLIALNGQDHADLRRVQPASLGVLLFDIDLALDNSRVTQRLSSNLGRAFS